MQVARVAACHCLSYGRHTTMLFVRLLGWSLSIEGNGVELLARIFEALRRGAGTR